MDLNDLMADVKYASAMQMETPDPQKAMAKVDDAQIKTFTADLEMKGEFTVAAIMSGPLGLYEFTRFLEGQGEVALAMGCFVMDCVLYKRSLSEAHRKTMQEAMKASYMGGGPPKKDKIPFADRFFKASEFCKEYLQYRYREETNLTPEDFNKFRILGKGGFGMVYGCRTFATGKMYAMKEICMKRIKRRKAFELCWNEHWALKQLDSPFAVNLKFAFKDRNRLVLVIDLMMGGDLKYWLAQHKTFDYKRSQYYAARTILGLKALHELNIVYRDIKPENMLVDESGRIRLSDLGLACRVHTELKGASGTPGYMAPEMLRKEVYDQRVDYFSYGCMLVEFILGVCPFRTKEAANWGGKKKKKKKKKDDEGDPAAAKAAKKKDACAKMAQAILEMNPDMSADIWTEPDFKKSHCREFCKKLLNKDPDKRLGAGGCQEIMDHQYFSELDFDAIVAETIEPPFAPGKAINAKDADAIGEFESLGAEVSLEDKDFDIKAWNFVSSKAYQAEIVWLLQSSALMIAASAGRILKSGDVMPTVPRYRRTASPSFLAVIAGQLSRSSPSAPSPATISGTQSRAAGSATAHASFAFATVSDE
ncbi:G-protein coupled receptor kinase [Aureococcus anophagefferens]|nr:G-protein coupled receptor kinase [Aureococcus anophagefferens]